MNRLTEKDILTNDYTYSCSINEFEYGNGKEEIVNKLGKIEDLEEQLGCPLDFIFKVLQAPKIYIEGMNVRSEYDDRFKFHSKTNNYIINPYAIAGKKPEVAFIDRWDYGYNLRLKDYKKTWWLKEDKSE